MITLRKEALEAAQEYAAALAEACRPFKADPVQVLIDTDRYPRIVRDLPMAEFLVGWFHGVEDVTGASLKEIWALASAGLAPVEKTKARPKAVVKEKGSIPSPAPGKVKPEKIAHAKDFVTAVDVVVVPVPPPPPPPAPAPAPRKRKKAAASAQTGLPL